MKIMIDISEKTYNEIMDDAKNTPRNLNYYERIIADGSLIDFGIVSSRQAVLDALCDECELSCKNGEQTCLTKCESYHFLATLLYVSRSENPNRCGDLISREETLTAFADYVGSGMSMNDYDALWDIVAKMPSVKTQEPCKDAISRQAACNIIDAIRDCISVEGYWAILERLKKLPSVSTEKTGRWIRWYEVIESADGKSTDHIPHCKCSECDCEYDTYSSQFIKYCSNCGAKMGKRGA